MRILNKRAARIVNTPSELGDQMVMIERSSVGLLCFVKCGVCSDDLFQLVRFFT